MQDRSVARYDQVSTLGPAPNRSVFWRWPLYDFSPTAVEVILYGAGGTGSLTLQITPPDEVTTEVALNVGDSPQQACDPGSRWDEAAWVWSLLFDDIWPRRGVECAANGTPQRTRLSGTSAIMRFHARYLPGLDRRPTD